MIRKLLVLATALGGLSFGASSAGAATVCFGGDLGSPSCTASNESMVFLEANTGVGSATNPGLGNIGSQTGLPLVNFTTGAGTLVDLANGYATITPTGSANSFSTLDISIPGYTFTDLDFGMQMFNNTGVPLNVTLTAYDGTTDVGSVTYTTADGLKHDANQEYVVLATSGVLTSVDVTSTSGIKQMKQFDVSGDSAIPEPSTWAMMLLGFAGLGYAGFRKSKASRTAPLVG
jgi:PEP-CTERM motif-containing protein